MNGEVQFVQELMWCYNSLICNVMQVSLPTDDVCDKVEYMEQLCKGLQKRITEILLMTQSMVHCVQYLYKILIVNP